MEKLILKPEIVETLKNDPVAIGSIAEILGVSFTTMPRMIMRNDAKLTQAGVLKYLRKRLSIKNDSDLLTELEPA